MKIEIIAIGNEVLSGLTLNTNATWLSKKLFDASYKVVRHSTLPDDEATLLNELDAASKRADCLICTGGLGPTLDDLTDDVAKKLFGEPHLLPNSVGSCEGLLFEKEGRCVILLPGVPMEMKAIFEQEVLPYLLKNYVSKEKIVQKKLNLCLLPERKVDPKLRELKLEYPFLEAGIYPQPGVLNITLTSNDASSLEEPFLKLKKTFKDNVFESESGKIDEAVHNKLIQRKKTLSLAESVTGGALAAKLTQHSGASNYFMGGLVTYSNTSKMALLRVDPQIIQTEGAVSEKVAIQMAEGAMKIFATDYSLSVTGVAGPDGGSLQKPIGTAWCALAIKDQPTLSWKIEGKATSRQMVIEYVCLNLLSNLYLNLVKS